jgi:hypothetical protein
MLVIRVTENVRAVQSSYYSSCPWTRAIVAYLLWLLLSQSWVDASLGCVCPKKVLPGTWNPSVDSCEWAMTPASGAFQYDNPSDVSWLKFLPHTDTMTDSRTSLLPASFIVVLFPFGLWKGWILAMSLAFFRCRQKWYWLNQRVIAYGALLSALAFLIYGYFLSWLYPFLTFLDRSQGWRDTMRHRHLRVELTNKEDPKSSWTKTYGTAKCMQYNLKIYVMICVHYPLNVS